MISEGETVAYFLCQIITEGLYYEMLLRLSALLKDKTSL